MSYSNIYPRNPSGLKNIQGLSLLMKHVYCGSVVVLLSTMFTQGPG